MANLTDMARTPAEKKKMADRLDAKVSPDDQPGYPYGLSLYLNDDSLRKLGIDELPTPGDELHVEGVVKVTGVRSSADEKDEDRSVELQVTHLSVEAEHETRGKGAKALYPTAKEAPDDEG